MVVTDFVLCLRKLEVLILLLLSWVLELVNTSTFRAEIGSGGSADVLESFTFRGPCIVIYSCNKTNEMHRFLIYFWN